MRRELKLQDMWQRKQMAVYQWLQEVYTYEKWLS